MSLFGPRMGAGGWLMRVGGVIFTLRDEKCCARTVEDALRLSPRRRRRQYRPPLPLRLPPYALTLILPLPTKDERARKSIPYPFNTGVCVSVVTCGLFLLVSCLRFSTVLEFIVCCSVLGVALVAIHKCRHHHYVLEVAGWTERG